MSRTLNNKKSGHASGMSKSCKQGNAEKVRQLGGTCKNMRTDVVGNSGTKKIKLGLKSN